MEHDVYIYKIFYFLIFLLRIEIGSQPNGSVLIHFEHFCECVSVIALQSGQEEIVTLKLK